MSALTLNGQQSHACYQAVIVEIKRKRKFKFKLAASGFCHILTSAEICQDKSRSFASNNFTSPSPHTLPSSNTHHLQHRNFESSTYARPRRKGSVDLASAVDLQPHNTQRCSPPNPAYDGCCKVRSTLPSELFSPNRVLSFSSQATFVSFLSQFDSEELKGKFVQKNYLDILRP